MSVERRRAAFNRGVEAESRAAALLAEQGFTEIARRVRTPLGEIDLIVRRGDLLVFVEVKARSSLAGAAYSILPRQRRRIVGAAEIFAAAHPDLAGLDMRLDVVLVAPDRPPVHIEGAFEAE
ncbi:YraN family protein [Ancylobacter crimeensis]|uniref:YraN family protein n=1 Tax=Ancylobacter crimeensis TaxID=2579147 RepID=UPI003CCFEF7C